MTDKEIMRIREKARAYVSIKGLPNDAEDIAQDVLIYYLENPTSKRPVRISAIEAIRIRFGRPASAGSKALMLARQGKSNVSIEDAGLTVEPKTYEKTGIDPIDTEIFPKRAVNMLNKIDRAIFMLTYGWGMKLDEISALFGISTGYVSDRLEAITRTLAPTAA